MDFFFQSFLNMPHCYLWNYHIILNSVYSLLILDVFSSSYLYSESNLFFSDTVQDRLCVYIYCMCVKCLYLMRRARTRNAITKTSEQDSTLVT